MNACGFFCFFWGWAHFNMVQINDLINNAWFHAMLVHPQRLKLVANGKPPQIHHKFWKPRVIEIDKISHALPSMCFKLTR